MLAVFLGLLSFCMCVSSDQMYGEPVVQNLTYFDDRDPEVLVPQQDELFDFAIPEDDEEGDECELVVEFDNQSLVESIPETSNFFTVAPEIYQDWRYRIAGTVSDHLFTVTNVETHPTNTALTVVSHLVFDGQLNQICDLWVHRMASTVYGPGGMRTAVVRALSMLGIMDQLHLLDEVKMYTKFSFPQSVIREFSLKQMYRLLSLTFKMEIVRVPFVMEKLRVISNEENLTDDDFLRFLELLGDIGVTHRMSWFMNLWPSY